MHGLCMYVQVHIRVIFFEKIDKAEAEMEVQFKRYLWWLFFLLWAILGMFSFKFQESAKNAKQNFFLKEFSWDLKKRRI
jgi:hypothetical protein